MPSPARGSVIGPRRWTLCPAHEQARAGPGWNPPGRSHGLRGRGLRCRCIRSAASGPSTDPPEPTAGWNRTRRPSTWKTPHLSATHLWPQPVTAPDVHPGRLCRQSRPGGGDPALSNAVITSTGSGEETVKVAALNCSTPETATTGCTTRSGTAARIGDTLTYRCGSPKAGT